MTMTFRVKQAPKPQPKFHDETMVYFGDELKALGDGKVGGYLIKFGGPDDTDASPMKDFFTKDTDTDLEVGDRRGVYYTHGFDPTLKDRKLSIGTVTEVDEFGIWAETQLDISDRYEAFIYKMAEEGRMGYSSGAATHLVRREKQSNGSHKVLRWPIGEISLTPKPAEPGCGVVALKSLPDLFVHPLGTGKDGQVEFVDPEVKTLPNGMTYGDVRRLLQDEANEDFGGGSDMWSSKYVPLVDFDETTCVLMIDGDNMQYPYTITMGNDVQWGAGYQVIQTTRWVKATEDAVNATKSLLPANSALVVQLEAVLGAVKSVAHRAIQVKEMRKSENKDIGVAAKSVLHTMVEELGEAGKAIEALLTTGTGTGGGLDASLLEALKRSTLLDMEIEEVLNGSR